VGPRLGVIHPCRPGSTRDRAGASGRKKSVRAYAATAIRLEKPVKFHGRRLPSFGPYGGEERNQQRHAKPLHLPLQLNTQDQGPSPGMREKKPMGPRDRGGRRGRNNFEGPDRSNRGWRRKRLTRELLGKETPSSCRAGTMGQPDRHPRSHLGRLGRTSDRTTGTAHIINDRGGRAARGRPNARRPMIANGRRAQWRSHRRPRWKRACAIQQPPTPRRSAGMVR